MFTSLCHQQYHATDIYTYKKEAAPKKVAQPPYVYLEPTLTQIYA